MKTLIRWLFDRPLKKGTVLEGRYRINRVLGMGNYGITYLAEELGRSGFRVIKQQRKTKAWTSAGRRSFNREAEILRELICLPRPVYMRCFERPASGLS
ncbi:serine/threonine-protein kinase [Bacillus licheniformis]|nr:serine/threonine-protein kinase [Bacillus licheniformis]